MSNQTPVGIQYIGLPALAALDLRYDLPDEFQVYLRDDHAVVESGTRHRQHHVRFGLAKEIDRPVIDLVRYGLEENRILREVGLASDHVHGVPRHPGLLAA